jgi:hypothetical protein
VFRIGQCRDEQERQKSSAIGALHCEGIAVAAAAKIVPMISGAINSRDSGTGSADGRVAQLASINTAKTTGRRKRTEVILLNEPAQGLVRWPTLRLRGTREAGDPGALA